MFLRFGLLVAPLFMGASLPTASADPLDCNDMAPVVREMLVDNLQVSRYLDLETGSAADAAFRMNYFHAERQEHQRTMCSVVISFDPVRFAKAERHSAALDAAGTLSELTEAAAGGLSRYAAFPQGIKVPYRLELVGDGRTWVVTLSGDPAVEHICALPDRHHYLPPGTSCSSPRSQDHRWRRSGMVETAISDRSRLAAWLRFAGRGPEGAPRPGVRPDRRDRVRRPSRAQPRDRALPKARPRPDGHQFGTADGVRWLSLIRRRSQLAQPASKPATAIPARITAVLLNSAS